MGLMPIRLFIEWINGKLLRIADYLLYKKYFTVYI